jgi:hypothetical protein
MFNSSNVQYGLIAQDVQPILPETVSSTWNEQLQDNSYGISYTSLIPVLIKAIQEQEQVIQSLKTEVDRLKTHLNI